MLRMRLVSATLVLMLGATVMAHATTFATTKLSDIAQLSGAVLSGQVKSKRTLLTKNGAPWTIYSMAVDGVLAGELAESEFSFRVMGGRLADNSMMVPASVPGFEIGDSIVMFYDRKSYCQVSGFKLGVFWRRDNDRGETRLVDFRNRAISSFSSTGPLFSDEVVPRKGDRGAQLSSGEEDLVGGDIPGAPAASASEALDELLAFSATYVRHPERITSTADLIGIPEFLPAHETIDASRDVATESKKGAQKP